MLMQVAPGTADPLTEKPEPHLHWSYLRDNQWIAFAANNVEDQTGGLLESGIVTLCRGAHARMLNTVLPQGMHWIRIAVASKPDAVCRLRMVAAQAVKATSADRGNASDFAAQALPPGTIAKLENRMPQSRTSLSLSPPSAGARQKRRARFTPGSASACGIRTAPSRSGIMNV